MRRLNSLGPLLILALAPGCNNSLDHNQAVQVMGSALTATGTADAHVMSSGADAQLDLTITNTHGTGTAHAVGTTTKSGDTVTTTFDVTFSHWTDAESHITLDGSLHESAVFSSPVPLTGTVEVSGALAASGAVNGSVDFDVKGSYSSTGFSVSGQVGGQAIDVMLGVSH
jgi:hypothetical protein